jgi:predicted NAD/FAD-binding protein
MDLMLNFSAVSLIRFFYNHGFLGMNTQHQWYTLQNGSQAYRELLIEPFKDKIKTSNGVVKVIRGNNNAVVHSSDGSIQEFDKVIFASHADQTLQLIEEPTPDQKRLLSPFKYQTNSSTVHTDESIMPKNKKVWSSWNYRIENINGIQTPTTIYWMNSLQQVSKNKNYFVSINAQPDSIDKNKILKIINYDHPLFDIATNKVQPELQKLNVGGPLYFCGSYFKYGFHEDAFASAVELCKGL